MTERVVVGPRANGDVGIFVSPPGVSAYTAPDSALTLSITTKIARLVQIGYVAAGGGTVALGFSRFPYLILDSWQATGGSSAINGIVTPQPYNPLQVVGRATATFNNSGASMTINAAGRIRYQIYNGAWA